MQYDEIARDPEILEYYKKGNSILGALGYTDHSTAHTALVAQRAAEILRAFGYSEKEVELARIAGFMHDIGNVINRSHHAEYGALLANEILKDKDITMEDRVAIVSAIANHDETTGYASDPITAAIVIADKSDVRRSRVRTTDMTQFDIHDRVNYAVTKSELEYSADRKCIALSLTIDEEICTMYDYFEIFFGRMMMCTKAAQVLGAEFTLMVNGRKVL
ncbi:MAG: HD domain-containing protein [Oscillospiraceae bacterium]|nr:HD domain-containing protein [Oscillospiraceae bacterium]